MQLYTKLHVNKRKKLKKNQQFYNIRVHAAFAGTGRRHFDKSEMEIWNQYSDHFGEGEDAAFAGGVGPPCCKI